jgi:hypothetical protein
MAFDNSSTSRKYPAFIKYSMRRAVAGVALGLMLVGLLLTAFGTRTTLSNQQPLVVQSCGENCWVVPTTQTDLPQMGCDVYGGCAGLANLPASSHVDFTLNYVGGILAILSAVSFVIVLPSTRNRSVIGPNLNALPLY